MERERDDGVRGNRATARHGSCHCRGFAEPPCWRRARDGGKRAGRKTAALMGGGQRRRWVEKGGDWGRRTTALTGGRGMAATRGGGRRHWI
uniref:Uncharacterized protein n=1 Tax=Oryza barthii TaxID=65489 RepID=A0A0D3GRD4_9ORYZ